MAAHEDLPASTTQFDSLSLVNLDGGEVELVKDVISGKIMVAEECYDYMDATEDYVRKLIVSGNRAETGRCLEKLGRDEVLREVPMPRFVGSPELLVDSGQNPEFVGFLNPQSRPVSVYDRSLLPENFRKENRFGKWYSEAVNQALTPVIQNSRCESFHETSRSN